MLFIDSLFLLENSPLWLIPGLALLLYGGKLLLDGSIGLARTLKISPLLIGLTIVAFGTSAPELAFNLWSATHQTGGFTFGNIVGSNIANIALVLGIAALVINIPVKRKEIGDEMGILLIASFLFIIFACYEVFNGTGEGGITLGFRRWHGYCLLAGFLGFTGWMIYQGNKERSKDNSSNDITEKQSFAFSLSLITLGTVILATGAIMTHGGALSLVKSSGLSQSTVGFFIIGLATSSPEIVTTVLACHRKSPGLAIGNIVGSNIFNLLLIFGLSVVIMSDPTLMFEDEIKVHVMMDMLAMLGFTCLLCFFTFMHSRDVIDRREGIALVTMYLVYAVFRTYMELTLSI